MYEVWIAYLIACSALVALACQIASLARRPEGETLFARLVRWLLFGATFAVWTCGAGAAVMLGIRLWGG